MSHRHRFEVKDLTGQPRRTEEYAPRGKGNPEGASPERRKLPVRSLVPVAGSADMAAADMNEGITDCTNSPSARGVPATEEGLSRGTISL
jgi:hypothetical protein